ncbi:MAG: Spy/CpxP family protein refolding chaperone [Bacteroidetes bacterium]|nr:Spy/CpxP family protein refolding chaperone [Bacteroidota bacterium]MCL5268028.1 Spy/CpxP family protein refolding chaperone [Bacteroidota bacterium]
MRSKLIVAVLGLLFAAGAAVAQPEPPRMHQMPMMHVPMLFARLKLTDQQKAEMQKIRLNLMQKQIDIRASIAHARLDYAELASATNPDQNALAAKIQDIAKLQGELRSNRLEGWFEVNTILTPEQQKIWKDVLQHPMMFRHNRMSGAWQGRMGRGGMMMNRMEMMRNGGGMGRNMNMWGRSNMMNRQNWQSPDSGK